MNSDLHQSELSASELERYSRQLILGNWGLRRQLQLRALSATIDSSLPSTALYLAAAGIGSLHIAGEQTSVHQLKAQIAALNPDVLFIESAAAEPTLSVTRRRDCILASLRWKSAQPEKRKEFPYPDEIGLLKASVLASCWAIKFLVEQH